MGQDAMSSSRGFLAANQSDTHKREKGAQSKQDDSIHSQFSLEECRGENPMAFNV
jgi:hypothetical protein